MSEDKLRLDTVRAVRAQALLDDPLLQEAFVALDTEYVQAWRNSLARDDDARLRIWHAVQALGKLRDHLSTVVSDGKLAQAQIDELIK